MSKSVITSYYMKTCKILNYQVFFFSFENSPNLFPRKIDPTEFPEFYAFIHFDKLKDLFKKGVFFTKFLISRNIA